MIVFLGLTAKFNVQSTVKVPSPQCKTGATGWRQQYHAKIIIARTRGRGSAGRGERDRKEEAAAKMAEKLRNLLVAESEERWQDAGTAKAVRPLGRFDGID